MTADTLVTGLVFIVAFYLLFFIGKLVHDALFRGYRLNHELVEKDNAALGLAVAGYYSGLVLALGGILAGPDTPLVDTLIDLLVYGILCILLMNLSWFLCDKLILFRFKMTDELIRDRNLGTGAVALGASVATGFIIYGAVQGLGGNIWTVTVFWALGQGMLILGGLVYNLITPYSIHEEIEKDNVAAGVGFSGALMAIGAVVGLAGESHFESWAESLWGYLSYAVVGLVLLPVVRVLTDRILLPTVSLSHEIANQETPNLGAAFIEAFSYIGAAFIIYWCV